MYLSICLSVYIYICIYYTSPFSLSEDGEHTQCVQNRCAEPLHCRAVALFAENTPSTHPVDAEPLRCNDCFASSAGLFPVGVGVTTPRNTPSTGWNTCVGGYAQCCVCWWIIRVLVDNTCWWIRPVLGAFHPLTAQ